VSLLKTGGSPTTFEERGGTIAGQKHLCRRREISRVIPECGGTVTVTIMASTILIKAGDWEKNFGLLLINK
jgi:hypothetical protein